MEQLADIEETATITSTGKPQEPTENLEPSYQRICRQLQSAVELELATLPPYLTAYFSIVEQTNTAAAELIRTVAMEEMLHLCLAGNVLVAIGGKVRLGEHNIPSYPLNMEFDGQGLRHRDFNIRLERFSPASLLTFRRIELPDDLPPLAPPEHQTSADAEFSAYSIGELYQEIIAGLEVLDQRYRAAGLELFSPDTSTQVTETYFWHGGGKPLAVTDIASARRAIKVIIDQGEGASGGIYDGDDSQFGQRSELSHYYKFSEVYYQRRYRPDDRPGMPPTGETLCVDFEQVHPLISDPKHSDYACNDDLAALNKRFNESYSLMLLQIEEAYAGNPKVLYSAIMNGMHDLTSIARTMMKIEVDPERSNETGTPTFEWVTPVAFGADDQ